MVTVRANESRFMRLGVALAALLALTACERELILPGERFDTRTPLADTFDPANGLGDRTLEDEDAEGVEVAARAPVPITLPATRNVADWTHRNGAITHSGPHAALPAALTRVWSADIGTGDSRKHRISATPVAGDGRIYTLDSQATVSAIDAASGAVLWRADLTPPADRPGDASGGGLAYGNGVLYVTSAFGTLTALDGASGAVIWRQALEAPATAAPTVEGNRVFVVSTDGVARAVSTDEGRILWTLSGAPNITGLVGGAGPAVSGRTVYLPLASGTLVAALKRTGIETWSTGVSGERLGRAYAAFTGITGDPVLDGRRIYVGNPQGRLIAVNSSDGSRIWTAREGAYGPVWPVGGNLFFVSDEARLVRVDAGTGETVWAEQLPYFVNDRPRRRRDVFAHFGPVLAGGRLLVASDDGLMRGFDPASGAVVETVEVPGGAATAPIVVGGTAYVVSTRGQLHAYR
jgi:outer membrane protein assembly factor BamB